MRGRPSFLTVAARKVYAFSGSSLRCLSQQEGAMMSYYFQVVIGVVFWPVLVIIRYYRARQAQAAYSKYLNECEERNDSK